MQQNIDQYGTTLRHPKPQLNEIKTLARCPPPNLPKSPTLVLKMGYRIPLRSANQSHGFDL